MMPTRHTDQDGSRAVQRLPQDHHLKDDLLAEVTAAYRHQSRLVGLV